MPAPTADDLKLLVAARDELQAERTRIANRLHADLLVLAPGLRRADPQPRRGAASRGRRSAARTARLRSVPQLARRRLTRLRALDREIAALEASWPVLVVAERVVAAAAARRRGRCWPPSSSARRVTSRRFRSEAAFAAVTGTAPIPASSGQTQRHRLQPGWQPPAQPGAALRWPSSRRGPIPPAQAYVARRRAEGKTWREALRCPQAPPRRRGLPDDAARSASRRNSGLDEIGAHELGLDHRIEPDSFAGADQTHFDSDRQGRGRRLVDAAG